MAKKKALQDPDLSRVAQQHLESLRRAGVEWLPNAPPPLTPTPAPQESLFAEPEPPPSAASTLTPEQRRAGLTVLAQQVSECTRCTHLVPTRTQTVFGVGPVGAEICFIGEAPGREEDRKGEPFVGPAGQLLNRIIAAMGLKREDVYICNILRCLPPGDRPGSVRPPAPPEAANCREWLDKTLGLVGPKMLVALGGSAAKYLLGVEVKITRERGQWREYQGLPLMLTYHPSYLLRQQGSQQEQAKREVWEDMKVVLKRLGKPVPGAK